jgi:hypothetical protein
LPSSLFSGFSTVRHSYPLRDLLGNRCASCGELRPGTWRLHQ